MRKWGQVLLGLGAMVGLWLLLSLFAVLTKPDPSVGKWSSQVISGFHDLTTQLTSITFGLLVGFGRRLLDLLEGKFGGEDRDPAPPPMTRGKGGEMIITQEYFDKWVREKLARMRALEQIVKTLRSIDVANQANKRKLIEAHQQEVVSLARRSSRSVKYRTILMTTLSIAVWHLVSAVVEAAWSVRAPVVPWMKSIAAWPPMNFLQTALFALGACVIVAWQYAKYVRITWDPSPRSAWIIGLLGGGIPGFIATLFTTQALFQATSASGWRPPYLGWPLFYYLLIVRLVAIPLLGCLTTMLVYLRVHARVDATQNLVRLS